MLILGIVLILGIFVAVGSGFTIYSVVMHRRAQAANDARTIRCGAKALFGGGEYLAQSEVDVWKHGHQATLVIAAQKGFLHHTPAADRAELASLCNHLTNLTCSVSDYNASFVQARIHEMSSRFDTIERYPLTDRQRQAIVTDEDVTLVVAGAGTGKTSTIAGKVDYLVRRGLARSSEILVLAFAKTASTELSERLTTLTGRASLKVSTFHALGFEVIGRVEGERPNLSRLAEDDAALNRFIDARVREYLSHPDYRLALVDFFTEMLDETPPGRAAVNGDEYIRAQRRSGLRALDGTLLKSREEVRIANWLILNGVAWEYERPYPVVTSTPMRRQYLPDFYLSDYDVYLEHFGLNSEGNTRPGIDRDRYLAAIEWKRELHAQNGTRLVETFTYDDEQGGLIARLSTLLQQQGVTPRPLAEEEIAEVISKSDKPYSDFVRLLAQFLSLFKGNGCTPDLVAGRARSERDRVFLTIFERVRTAYEAELSRTRTIDFNDMINRARSHVREGRFVSPYRYTLVDEFQDISENRLGLLQDLRAPIPHSRLFVVGDDWQSIFRFAGSDVGLMTNLAKHVGTTERVDLDTTFRYPQELLDVSSEFVTRNPLQLRKTLRAKDGPAWTLPVCVIYQQPSKEGAVTAIKAALRDIRARRAPNEGGGEVPSVLVLGRYKFNEPDDMKSLKERCLRDGFTIEFMTTHKAKGQEADFVIVVALEDGEYGFPSNVADDPVTRMVLSDPETFDHAEERRLFYTAITRAKRRVYLIAPPDRASTFVRDDLLGTNLRDYVEVIGEESKRYLCPVCGGKTVRRTQGGHGAFWACANYPLCIGKLDACPACHDGGLAKEDATAGSYHCTLCEFEVDACPECGRGYLRQRVGRFGPFQGCSQWNSAGCPYTRNAPMHIVG